MHPLLLIKIGILIVGLMLILIETTLIVVNKQLAETTFGYLIGTIILIATLLGTLAIIYYGMTLT